GPVLAMMGGTVRNLHDRERICEPQASHATIGYRVGLGEQFTDPVRHLLDAIGLAKQVVIETVEDAAVSMSYRYAAAPCLRAGSGDWLVHLPWREPRC
ncbi:MAG TPA: hypothetical protein VFX61_14495, partial [Micromonosporaceae bacterium]|nr:hypothetical protein [Micromonosporaceae bacterium]